MAVLTRMVLALMVVLAPVAASAAQDDERVVIKFQPGKGPQGKAALAAAGGRIARDLEPQNAVGAWIPSGARQALERNPNVLYVEDDQKRYPLTTQTVPWGIKAVQADDRTLGGSSSAPLVCIIDSGYSLGHDDLPISVDGAVTDPDLPWNEDGCGHGTHVAGTISALDNSIGVIGVVPSENLNLHIVRVFDNQCTWAYSSDLVAALNKCTEAGADVVSMSLGCSGGPGGGPFSCRNSTEEQAFNDAYASGVLSFAAAGNDGNTSKSYPASYDSVVSVAAVDSADNVASFSQQNNQVELAAPGVAVRSTVPMGTGTDESFVSGGASFEVIAMEGSFEGTASGQLVDCGLGDTPCSGASGQICLIQRGDITFAEKVQNCQAGGGLGAVIYNNVPGLYSGTLGGVSTSIPSVGMSQADGQALTAGADSTITVEPGDYAYYDGTSMATPHASGVAALVWSNNPGWSNQQIRDALDFTALDLGAGGRDNAYGYGLVQAKAALQYLNGSGSQSSNQPPQASFTFSCIGLSCEFDASGSSDDGGITSYAWTFGDGPATAAGVTAAHVYAAAGTYTVTLTVQDAAGLSDQQSHSVMVAAPSTSGITLTATGYKVKGRQKVDLTWTGTSAAIDIYRDGSVITATTNDGAYTDNIDNRGGGSYTYRVCEAGTSTCSNDATVTF